MSGVELVALNTRAGYGQNSSQIERDGNKETLETGGAALSGDLALGLTAVKENGTSRGKVGLNLVNAQADILAGQASDKYLRLALNLGPSYYLDVSGYNRIRVALQVGLNARVEYTKLKSGNSNASGTNWNAALPVAFGLGTSHIFLQDKVQAMTNFSDLKVRNEASGSLRIYANLNNTFLQTIDITLSHIYESGRLAGGIDEKSTLVMAGLSLGLFNYSLKTD